MLSSYSIKTANRSCWTQTRKGDLPSTLPSNTQNLPVYTYPSIGHPVGPYIYPASIEAQVAQMRNSRGSINTRISVLANAYCHPLQTIHDNYAEKFALSPEEDPYSERFALSPDLHARVYNGGRRIKSKKGKVRKNLKRLAEESKDEALIRVPRGWRPQAIVTLREDSEDCNLLRGPQIRISEAVEKTLPEQSQDEYPIKYLQGCSPQAQETDEEATRLIKQAARLEESVNKLTKRKRGKNDEAFEVKGKKPKQRYVGSDGVSFSGSPTDVNASPTQSAASD